MPYSGDLFERVANAPEVPQGLPLIVLLTGFTDAGGAVAGLMEHLHELPDSAPLLVFDNDALLDYRARRPVISFEHDHLTDYRPARLELALMKDALGQKFLVLSGYEPDFAWNSFTDAVLDLAEQYRVSGMTWVHAIAMPVPHTRAMGTTVSGNRSELVAAHSVWKPRTQVPATVGHLLEYRFAERGDTVVGFVLLVPHYLAETEHPGAVMVAADRVMTATGLVFSMDSVREREKGYLTRVQEQVEHNDELQAMIATLEQRHDAYMAGRDSNAAEQIDEESLPSADELAAELERYLANRRPGDEGKDSH
ncbi:proteasome assembly chaperone family protein [Microbacterium sp. YY-01]|uniref:proteasome assembly chaperone family protein n=1 Tax=Microbacterium sp. YY-01 TaxID=3421634 RepID=UPI003D182A34